MTKAASLCALERYADNGHDGAGQGQEKVQGTFDDGPVRRGAAGVRRERERERKRQNSERKVSRRRGCGLWKMGWGEGGKCGAGASAGQ